MQPSRSMKTSCALTWRFLLYHRIEDYEKSVAHAETAYKLEPDDPFNAAALSVTYQRAFEGTRDPVYIQKAESVNTNMR